MPRNVKRFAWLWLISFLLTIPAIFFLTPLPDEQAAKFGMARSAEIKLSIGILLLLMAILFPFFRLAVWKRRNWARWLLFAVFVLCLPLIFVNHPFHPDNLPMTIYSFGTALLEGAAFYFLFTGDARAWFEPQRAK